MRQHILTRALLMVGLCLFSPSALFAGVSITEIMYDLPGTDTGREWIEVKNTGSEEISFQRWKLFEANTNHGLSLFQGNATTSSGGFAIVADDASKFLTDNPSYSGTLFSSNFSLSNTGEVLELKLDNASVYQATYTTSGGGAGDGNSLHFLNNGWQAGAPTPGSESAGETLPPDTSVSSSTPSAEGSGATEPPASAPSSNTGGTAWTYTPQIFVNALSPKTGVAGAPVVFDAVAVGTKKELLPNARYLWSFGDGGVTEGKKVQHIYHYPAVYTVLVDASSGEWSATDRKEIVITAPELSLPNVKEGTDGYIEIRNDGKSEVDLSLWLLKTGTGLFTIPRGTVIGAKKSIPFPAVITNLSADAQQTALLYPNGNLVVAYTEKPIVAERVVVPADERNAVIVALVPEQQPSVPIPPAREEPKEEKVAPAVSPARIASSTELIGSVGGAEDDAMLLWLGGVALLVVVSVGAYMAMLRTKANSPADELRKEVAMFDIIED